MNMGVLWQVIITILSTISAINLSNFQIWIVAQFHLSTEVQAAISIVCASISFIMACCKSTMPVFPELTGQRESNQKQLRIMFSYKALMVNLTDFVFDMIASIALLTHINYNDNDRIQIYVILGTWIGVGDEIIELIIDVIDHFCNTTDPTNCICFQYSIGMIEIICGIYLLANINWTNYMMFAIISVCVELLVFGCICCNLLLILWRRDGQRTIAQDDEIERRAQIQEEEIERWAQKLEEKIRQEEMEYEAKEREELMRFLKAYKYSDTFPDQEELERREKSREEYQKKELAKKQRLEKWERDRAQIREEAIKRKEMLRYLKKMEMTKYKFEL